MNRPLTRLIGSGLLLGMIAGSAGCTHQPAQAPAPGPPTVSVSYPIQREITDYKEYPGRTAAINEVQVRSRVTGYLQKVHFQDGADVKVGDVLYEIDPRPYRATLEQMQAQVELQQAQLKYQEAVYQRSLSLYRAGQAVSLEEVQQNEAQRNTTRASLEAARANVAQARLNLEWTKVQSPIDGRLSRTLVTPGNLVVADQTLLTTIVSQDPMYAYFDVDEATMLRVQELIREGKYRSAREKGVKVPVDLGLMSETGFPHQGHLDFINNQVSPSTGTLQLRGVFANPAPPIGPRLLSPGLFVRIRVAVSAPYQALLVTQAALGTDQNRRYVYVVNDQDQAARQDVTLGAVQDGGLQVIATGLKETDRVVVNGTQHVHPGITVNPRLVPMPVTSETGRPSAAPAGGARPPAPAQPQPAPAMQQNYPTRGQTR